MAAIFTAAAVFRRARLTRHYAECWMPPAILYVRTITPPRRLPGKRQQRRRHIRQPRCIHDPRDQFERAHVAAIVPPRDMIDAGGFSRRSSIRAMLAAAVATLALAAAANHPQSKKKMRCKRWRGTQRCAQVRNHICRPAIRARVRQREERSSRSVEYHVHVIFAAGAACAHEQNPIWR